MKERGIHHQDGSQGENNSYKKGPFTKGKKGGNG
jgi:hypothetical protein